MGHIVLPGSQSFVINASLALEMDDALFHESLPLLVCSTRVCVFLDLPDTKRRVLLAPAQPQYVSSPMGAMEEDWELGGAQMDEEGGTDSGLVASEARKPKGATAPVAFNLKKLDKSERKAHREAAKLDKQCFAKSCTKNKKKQQPLFPNASHHHGVDAIPGRQERRDGHLQQHRV